MMSAYDRWKTTDSDYEEAVRDGDRNESGYDDAEREILDGEWTIARAESFLDGIAGSDLDDYDRGYAEAIERMVFILQPF